MVGTWCGPVGTRFLWS